jgi:AcrR family transcriptional regulator
LIDIGETLFGQRGFDGISLREIAAAAEQANNYVVQYHFKSKNGLISAILEDRSARLELIQRERFAALGAKEQQDPRELMKVLWLSLLAIRDDHGNHSFCRFLLQYMIQPRVSPTPLFASFRQGRKGQETQIWAKIASLLHAHYDELSSQVLARRLAALSMMFLSSVIEYDNARLSGTGKMPAEFDADFIIDMALGALSAPG